MKTDIELIQSFQGGNFDAFGVIYERYIDKIFVYILRKVGEREQAEDICSQVWMRALRDLEKSEKGQDFYFQAWIYRIAHNSVIDWYRTCKESVSEEILESIPISEDIAGSIDTQDTLIRVEKYLENCKESEKNILLLRLWDEMSYKEIAEFVGKSEAACKQVVKRGIEKLKANIVYMLIFFVCIL
ncbi:sigma-70 family RNA polymerase sigma factor [Candidatus Gracilibacteria bacterium]|nr:sigma-70 family RNA polymerase sigma factor [Candidatus Gracilibacteria bacterium]